MKKLFYLLSFFLIVILFISCEKKNENNFTINIKINGVNDGWVYMQQNESGNWIKYDSAELKNGSVVFSGNIDMPEMFYFTIENHRGLLPVFIENGNINVVAEAQNLRQPKVDGSKSQDTYLLAIKTLAEYDEKERVLDQQYQEAQAKSETDRMDSISTAFDNLEKEKTNSIKEFAENNNSSVVAPFIMMNYSYLFELNDLESVAQKLDPVISDSKYTTSLNNRINILKRVEVGQPYVDFTLNDPEGNPLPLSSVVGGKYLLIDFWASWCRPCRAENPNVVAAYQKFHDKGFDVFGVSLDRDHDKWVEAIKQDNLTWSHVSDLKYWGNEAAKLYGVQSIPHNVLLSPEGTIIAKNLRGEELQKKLTELLD